MPTITAMVRRSLVGVCVLLFALTACGGDDGETADDPGGSDERTHAAQPENPDGAACQYQSGAEAAREVEPPADTAAYEGQVPVTIETSVGDIEASLDADAAPCTVNSFTSLASQGYFDDTTCHRLTTEGIFVLQCGDPDASGMGGPGYSFADELSGDETYGAGTLAMANAGPETNGSQFFIVYGDTPLPPSYTVFGSVSEEGVGIVEKVAEDGADDSNGPGDGAPNTPVDIEFVEVG